MKKKTKYVAWIIKRWEESIDEMPPKSLLFFEVLCVDFPPTFHQHMKRPKRLNCTKFTMCNILKKKKKTPLNHAETDIEDFCYLVQNFGKSFHVCQKWWI
jgi:hypothetical protein